MSLLECSEKLSNFNPPPVPSFFDFILHASRSLLAALFSSQEADFELHSFYFGRSQSSALVQLDTF